MILDSNRTYSVEIVSGKRSVRFDSLTGDTVILMTASAKFDRVTDSFRKGSTVYIVRGE